MTETFSEMRAREVAELEWVEGRAHVISLLYGSGLAARRACRVIASGRLARRLYRRVWEITPRASPLYGTGAGP